MFDQRRDALRRWAALLESACRNHGRYENNLIEMDGPTIPQQLK
jgi:hypothetical protein